jgi:hypothetical protein
MALYRNPIPVLCNINNGTNAMQAFTGQPARVKPQKTAVNRKIVGESFFLLALR